MNRRSLIKALGFFTLNSFIKKPEANVGTMQKQENGLYPLPISYLKEMISLPIAEDLYFYIGKPNSDPLDSINQIELFDSKTAFPLKQPLIIKTNENNIDEYFVKAEGFSIKIFNSKNEALFYTANIQLRNIIEKDTEKCNSLDELRYTPPKKPGQRIYVIAHSIGSTFGGGYFQHDASDKETLDNDGTVIVTTSGERWKRNIENPASELKAVWFGVRSELDYDSSAALQNTINEAERIVKEKKAKRISIKLPPLINTQQSIYLNPAYSFLEPVAGITEWQIENSQGEFHDNYAIHITGDLERRGGEDDIPYVNNTIYILSHIYIYEHSNKKIYNKVNCIKHYSTLEKKRGISEIVSQIGILKCRFTGFSDIYSNGDNGWGICFWECGFDKYNRAIVLSSGINNSERITFRECVLQNGQLAFDIHGWTGGLLIDNCSINYNKNGEIINRGGYVIVRGGHIETRDRKFPICINEDTPIAVGKAKFQDVTFVNFGIDGNDVNLFTSTRKHNLIIEDNRFSWAENENKGTIASRNTKMTDSIGCIFIRNWQMSGEEGRPPLITEGLLQSPPPIHLKKDIKGNLNVNAFANSKNSNDFCINKAIPFSANLKNNEKNDDKLTIQCPIINSYQHRFLTWIIKLSHCELKHPVEIKVFALDENGSLIEQLGSGETLHNNATVLYPQNYENYINNCYYSIAIEFNMENCENGDGFSISAIGAIAYN